MDSDYPSEINVSGVACRYLAAKADLKTPQLNHRDRPCRKKGDTMDIIPSPTG
jgi:hypothetical protein